MKKHFVCANTALSTPPCNSHRVGTISLFILALMLGFSTNVLAETKAIAGNGNDRKNGWCCDVNWNINACFMEGTDANQTKTFYNLPATIGDAYYEFKLTNRGEWKGEVGCGATTCSGTATKQCTDAGTGNVSFSLSEASDVTITYNGSNITVVGVPAVVDPCPNCKTITK